MMKRLALVSVVALSFTACGGSDDVAATATEGDAFCKLAQVARDQQETLEDVDPTDASALELNYSAAIDSVSAMAAKAPKDISATVNKLLDEEEELEGLLKENDYDFTKLAASDEGKAILEENTISETGKELDAYIGDKCNIDTTEDTAAVDDTIATDDTIAVDDTIVPDETLAPGVIDLGEGEEAINKFLDFYELGTGSTLTDEQRACIVDALADDVTGDELNEAIAGQPSEELQQALGLAFIGCDVTVG
jgi:hypothetical protein